MRKVVTILLWLFLPFAVTAQVTGYTDTFDGDLVATGPATFGFTQENGMLLVDVHKPASTTWQAINYPIGTRVDLTENPYVVVRLKTDNPCILSVYIQDVYYVAKNINRKIYASDTFVDYYFDFSNVSSIDKTYITTMLFTPNGNTQDAFDSKLYIDDLKIGSDATQLAGLGAISNQEIFINSLQNKISVLDISNSTGLTATSVNGMLGNIAVGTVNDGRATILFDANANVFGEDTLNIAAQGEEGFADNTIHVPISIQPNFPPTLDPIADMEVMAGDTTAIPLNGIGDGNTTVEQELIINVTSSNQDAIPDSSISMEYVQGEPNASLTFAALQAAENVELTVTIDDQAAQDNQYQSSFMVDVYANINRAPVIDPVADQFVYIENGQQAIALHGISDGDDGSQQLTFTVESSDTNVIANGDLGVDYTQGSDTASLVFTPDSIGSAIINLILKDDGGTDSNNGDQQTVISFTITIGNLPVTGHVADFTSMENWGVDALGTQQEAELGSFKGRDHVLKITLDEKSCWTGTMYFTPEMNVDEYRYLCYDIYLEGESFHLNPPLVGQGFTHCYFWDDGWDANLNRNVDAAHAQRKRAYEGQWTTVLMDFRGAGGMNNAENEEINVKRIQKILLNYASEFTWPFPSDNGTVYLSNLRIGSAVPDSLLPVIPTVCTIKASPNQVMFKNSGPRTVTVTGISSGKDNPATPEIVVTSSDTNVVPIPALTDNHDGTADLVITPKTDSTGTSTIQVSVSAENAQTRTISFKVDVIEQETLVTLELDRDTLFQEIRGFGTFQFEGQQHYLDLYTDDLGASAVRTGLISNQIEWMNDNDDPNVLNLDGYDRNAFDFDYYRQLKDRGVETFILTSWSPPAWMKRNMSVSYAYAGAPNYNQTDNILEPYYYDEFAESMVAAVKMFKIYAGIDLYAIGPQNEPAFCEPYASAVLSPSKFVDLLEIIGERFKNEGISTQLYMPEQVFTQAHYSMDEYINNLKSSPVADEYTRIIATHGYDDTGVTANQPTYDGWSDMWKNALSCQYDKELWMSETFPEYSKWSDALGLAGAIHGALVYGNVSLWTLWSIEGTLINQGVPTASFYTSKNYYKFIRPGARRFRVYENNNDILATGFIHPETRQQTLVIINKGTEPISITLAGNYHAESYDQYTTAQYLNFSYMGKVTRGGQVALPASSVTTLVGTIDGPIVTDIDDDASVPGAFQLYQNYPNPFNPMTTIRFNLAEAAHTSIIVYNVLGQKVRTLTDQSYAAGQHELIWDGMNDSNMQVSSGLYFYRIKSGNHIKTLKCVLIR